MIQQVTLIDKVKNTRRKLIDARRNNEHNRERVLESRLLIYELAQLVGDYVVMGKEKD